MPTPRPIRRASSLENDAMLSTFDNRPSRALAVPNDTPAVSSGSIIAGNVPNTANSTAPAARNPIGIAVEEPDGSPTSATWPPAANWTPRPEAELTIESKATDSAVDRFAALWLKLTVANATWLDGGIGRARGGPWGDVIEPTWGSRATLRISASARARTGA